MFNLKRSRVTIAHPISLTPVYFTSLRASHFFFVLHKLAKSLFVLCSYVPFFILLVFRCFMALTERKIQRKTGSHNEPSANGNFAI